MTLIAERAALPTATAARRAMIDSQLRVSGVNDSAVLAAMSAVAREDFVPAALRANAYVDRALPLADGAALAAPLVHGRMLVEAAVQPGEKVLVISDSGYLAALAAAMDGEVTLISPGDAAATK
ncbi:MAG: protein-L-isoaspartate O-methyltransferase, partial [Novosphingobium sp.]